MQGVTCKGNKTNNLQGVTCRGVLGRYCRGLITCKGHKTNNLQVVTCRVLGRLQGGLNLQCTILPTSGRADRPTASFFKNREAVLASNVPSLPETTSPRHPIRPLWSSLRVNVCISGRIVRGHQQCRLARRRRHKHVNRNNEQTET